MKLFSGWVISAGLVLSATAANAQVLAPYGIGIERPYTAVSDVAGPYAMMPEEIPAPRYGPTYYGPMLLPPQEIYAILRENGFSPLSVPRQRGLFYSIAVIDRSGDDGRLVIDGRTGRIVRFMPAYRMGGIFNDEVVTYGPGGRELGGPGPLPPMTYGTGGPAGPLPPISDLRSAPGDLRGAPRPPAAVPRVASRTPPVPMPKASPRSAEVRPEARPHAASPAPAPAPQQSAAVQTKPAETELRAAPPAPATLEAKPAPQIQPTQPMPKAQGLD